MIPPDTAEQARRALIAWGHHLRQTGQPTPDGWGAFIDLLAAHVRTDDTPPWLTLEQAAGRVHVTERTLFEWRRDGLPSSKVRGRVLIHRDDLDRWVRNLSDDLPETVGDPLA